MKITIILAWLIVTVSAFPGLSPAAGDWEFVIAPYALVPSIDGDTTIGRVEGIDIDVGPSDILNNLEMGAMIQLEAIHKSGFGVITAYNFMDLGGGATGPNSQADLDVDIYQGIFEGYGLYRMDSAKGPFDIYAGVRWWDIDVEVKANGTQYVENKPDWVDPVVGFRWMPDLSQNWGFIFRADVGGFGVSSDFTWNVQGGFSWDATDYLSLMLQYRALSVDYTTGTVGTPNRFAYDTITPGPILGLAFRL